MKDYGADRYLLQHIHYGRTHIHCGLNHEDYANPAKNLPAAIDVWNPDADHHKHQDRHHPHPLSHRTTLVIHVPAPRSSLTGTLSSPIRNSHWQRKPLQ